MSTLLPGIQVIASPRFHTEGAWSDRLTLNSGIAVHGDQFLPRPDWRPLTQIELEFLTRCNDPFEAIQLLSIPERLQSQWWSLAAERSEEGNFEDEAFKSFAKDVLEYLLFKKMPLPPESTFEVVLTALGLPSVRANAGGLLSRQNTTKLLGGINLSDEDSSLIFLNLRENSYPKNMSETSDEDRRSFLLDHADYPLTRMVLRPREGYWFPRGPIIADRDTRGRAEIDVHLEIKQSSSLSLITLPPGSKTG